MTKTIPVPELVPGEPSQSLAVRGRERLLESGHALWLVGLAVLLLKWMPLSVVEAGEMDPTLSRFALAPGKGGCPEGGPATRCPDDESFEHLVAELAGGLAPSVGAGAAGAGARGFYVGLSSTATSLRRGESYWSKGTLGGGRSQPSNDSVDAFLMWNRLEVRKGLPFGFELGSSVGFGAHTSLWVLSAELKVALFEGFRSGLGALPDVSLRGVTQTLIGSSELSLHTNAFDVTLSKPFVVAQQYVLTPLLALQLLLVSAKSGVIDLTPAVNAFSACAPGSGQPNGVDLSCSEARGPAELANNRSFQSVRQTRVRMVIGAEQRYRLLSVALTAGLDLTTPGLAHEIEGYQQPKDLLRQFSLHLATGLRY